MKKQNKTIKKTFDWHVQVHFIIWAALFFLVTMGTSVFAMFAQFQNNTNLSSYYFYVLSTLLMPLLIVAASYFITPNRPTKIEKIFWTLVVSFAAMLLFVTVQSFTWYMPMGMMESYDENSWMLAEVVRIVISFIPVVIYFAYVYYLKRTLSKAK